MEAVAPHRPQAFGLHRARARTQACACTRSHVFGDAAAATANERSNRAWIAYDDARTPSCLAKLDFPIPKRASSGIVWKGRSAKVLLSSQDRFICLEVYPDAARDHEKAHARFHQSTLHAHCFEVISVRATDEPELGLPATNPAARNFPTVQA